MKKKYLYIIWAGLFIICAALGFIGEPSEALRALGFCLSAAFFVVPGWLVWKGGRQDAMLVRNLSIASLVLSVVMILVNLLSIQSSETVGDVMYAMLVILSTPMIASGIWALSLFCWAFLMIWAIKNLKK